MDNLSIYHPRVIATARFLGITELQALRHERAREFLKRDIAQTRRNLR